MVSTHVIYVKLTENGVSGLACTTHDTAVKLENV